MLTDIRVVSCCFLLAVGLFGCNEATPPPSASYSDSTQRVAPGPEFKISPETLNKAKAESIVAEVEVAEAEIPPEEPRRKTVVESLFQAVRNGAAAAMDEGEAGQ